MTTTKTFRVRSNFASADGTSKLKVYAHQGKAGFLVGVSMKTPNDKRAQSGCQESFETQEAAQTRYEGRVQEAIAAGWVKKTVGGGGGVRVSHFSAIPTAPVATASPIAVVPKEPIKTASGAGMSNPSPRVSKSNR